MINSLKKKIFLMVLSLIPVTACTNNITQKNPVKTEVYQFKTNALTDSYIRRALETYINAGSGVNLVKEINYGITKYPEQLTRVIQSPPNLCTQILAFNEVRSALATVPSFFAFMDITCPEGPTLNVEITLIPAPMVIGLQ
jgi:hypothetical protein